MHKIIAFFLKRISRIKFRHGQQLITQIRTFNRLDFYNIQLSREDSQYIYRLKGIAILTVVFGHLGLGWIFPPYCSYINLVVPLFFFCSGYLLPFMISKKGNTLSFWSKRIWNLIIPFYTIYFTALIISALLNEDFSQLNAPHFVRILILAPLQNETPYPLGQIWFLRVLLFVIFVSPLVMFIRDKIGNLAFTIPIFLALILSAVQNVAKVHGHFYYVGHSLYQEIVYGSFYFFGTILACVDWRKIRLSISVISLITLIVAVTINTILLGSFNLSHHSYAPDSYYYLLGLVFILSMLMFAHTLTKLIEMITPISWLVDYSGRVSYSLFLIHSFFIMFTENQWGWVGVKDKPALALAKVLFVVIASLIVSYPITRITHLLNGALSIAPDNRSSANPLRRDVK